MIISEIFAIIFVFYFEHKWDMLHISLQYFKDNKNWKEFQEFSRLSLPQYVKLIFLNK
jgi:hypothetical protein